MTCRHSFPFRHPEGARHRTTHGLLESDVPRVYVRHGFASSYEPFEDIAEFLCNGGQFIVDNASYCWQCPVIKNGLGLAIEIAKGCGNGNARVAIVGHSMGGLVARVSHLALLRSAKLRKSLEKNIAMTWVPTLKDLDDIRAMSRELEELLGNEPANVSCVITIATPNSGALANFELANLVNLLGVPGKWAKLAE